jgi:hypothetical protein
MEYLQEGALISLKLLRGYRKVAGPKLLAADQGFDECHVEVHAGPSGLIKPFSSMSLEAPAGNDLP